MKNKKVKQFKFCESFIFLHIFSAIAHPKNFFLCLKYPFLRIRNSWTNKFIGYSITWYHDIPEGWRIAFGKQLLKDIAKALKADKVKKVNWAKALCLSEVKEKFGRLTIYAQCSDTVEEVLDYYELLSMAYCIRCGKLARYCTRGWISYLCEDCYIQDLDKGHPYIDNTEKNLAYKRDRLTKENIPNISAYNNKTKKFEKIDIKKEYKIDFEKLWSL